MLLQGKFNLQNTYKQGKYSCKVNSIYKEIFATM